MEHTTQAMRTQKRKVLRTEVNPHISSITEQSLSLVVHSFLNHGGPVKFAIDCSLGPVKSFRKFLAQKMRNALSVDLKRLILPRFTNFVSG